MVYLGKKLPCRKEWVKNEKSYNVVTLAAKNFIINIYAALFNIKN